MTAIFPSPPSHQLGEVLNPISLAPPETVTVQTPGGPLTVAWEPGTSVSVHGMAVFFIEFLHVTGLWAELRDRCPLHRTSPNAPDRATVVGSLLLSVLSGSNRYRHIDGLRGDKVLPELLGMRRIISPDSMLRAVRDIAKQETGLAWVRDVLLESLLPVVRAGPWILDLDSTVVMVYGKQGGSAKGYNPTKPGRPSYSYHALLIGGLRLPLDVEARPGNESHAAHGAEHLWHFLDHRLPVDAQPWCIRGDISYGNESTITGCEERHRDFLFKLRKSGGVKALLGDLDRGQYVWEDAGHGWEGRDDRLQLTTWTSARRVVILRRFVQASHDATPKISPYQESLFIAELCPDDGYEYAVLVTSLHQGVATIAQFYRDRADCENTFADIKGDWSWGGFTTQHQDRNQLMACFTALIYTWWNIFVRQVSPIAHREGHVSRPILLHGVARRVTHAGKTILRLTSLHAKSQSLMMALSALTQQMKHATAHAASQLASAKPWDAIIGAIFAPLIQARAGPTP